ncbi:hypothetical protein JCM19233_3412 [Vibrio astriarenae]|nr:hypothetical protein JCM19233_3412 [Vibrio sp. C7]
MDILSALKTKKRMPEHAFIEFLLVREQPNHQRTGFAH